MIHQFPLTMTIKGSIMLESSTVNNEQQDERYYDYMLRNMKEADMKEGKEKAMQNAKQKFFIAKFYLLKCK